MNTRFFASFSPSICAGIVLENILEYATQSAFMDRLQQDFPRKTAAPFTLWMAQQVHGTDLLEIPSALSDFPNASILIGDALITRDANTVLLIKTADCIPILIEQRGGPWIAAIHAGWRGLTANIVPKVLNALTARGVSVRDLHLGIGPSLGPCCSEFSDPFNEIPQNKHFAIAGKTVDLWAILACQLQEAGLTDDQIEWMRTCSHCDPECFSWRRGHDPRRMGTFIVRSNFS